MLSFFPPKEEYLNKEEPGSSYGSISLTRQPLSCQARASTAIPNRDNYSLNLLCWSKLYWPMDSLACLFILIAYFVNWGRIGQPVTGDNWPRLRSLGTTGLPKKAAENERVESVAELFPTIYLEGHLELEKTLQLRHLSRKGSENSMWNYYARSFCRQRKRANLRTMFV